jgi:hypothetical protein
MRARRPRSNAKDAHRPGDVLDLLLAQIIEGEVELVADMVVHRPRHADPAGLGQGFEAGGDVDAVAVDVVVVADDVAEIDADAEFDAPLGRHIGVALGHSLLHLDGAAHRIDDAGATSIPSPVVLTTRPRCSTIFGSASSRRIAFSAASVPSSSAPISRE